MSTLKVGGQCEGYGGIFEALRTILPVEHAWYAEIDPAASKVLAHHYPGVPNHGDITAFDWATAGQVDIFTAGFPCQGFSMAGKRRGSSDERHLWPVGVLPAIRELMPPLVVLENVPGLLTIEHGQVFGTVLADLDALGYTVSWTTIGACRVGACHHRHRVFLAATLANVGGPLSDPVAHRRPGGLSGGWAPAQDVLFGDFEALRWPASGFTAASTAWELPVQTCGADGFTLPTPRAIDGEVGTQTLVDGRTAGDRGPRLGDIGALLDMFPTPTARDATRGAGWGDQPGRPLSEVVALLPTPRTSDTNGIAFHGNGGLDLRTAVALLPTPTANLGRGAGAPSPETAQARLAHGRRFLDDAVALLPTPRASDGEKGGPNQRGSSGDVMLPAAVQPERFGKYAEAVRRHELAYGLPAPDPTEPGRTGRPRLSAAFPEFMQGLAAGWLTDVVDRRDALRLAGNGVNPRQAAYALSTLPTFRAATALTAEAVAA